jgi:8-oxo-dGTP pyrophosphatase MutT (NUDIX family)
MSVFARRLARDGRFDRSRFLRFFVGGEPVGWLRPVLGARLARWPDLFDSRVGEVHLASRLATSDARSEALALVVRELTDEGLVAGWRGERYAISTAPAGPTLFWIERAAVRPFGLSSLAVHINGIAAGDPKKLWIARRSRTKSTDPGMLDNLVGGGVGAGFSADEVLVKEAWEEAGIEAALARSATRGGTAHILREVVEGVQSETILAHDLALPPDFRPQNQDGEIEEFRLVPAEEVLALVRDTEEFTLDAALVTLDHFLRKGVIAPSDPRYAGLARWFI